MEKRSYQITFEYGSVADMNVWAGELKEMLLNAAKDIEVGQRRDNPYSMDLGSTLVLLLGTSSITAAVTALGNWLALHNQAGITIKTSQGEMVAEKITRKDVMKLAAMFLSHQEKD
ncbi:hypothetical protein ccbrp13_35610 [Ktedonobacteria bacterium brp13]|nr:hypothetical protein ccbrp13_35610 [Ktedonobacteria bacterium brp13]